MKITLTAKTSKAAFETETETDVDVTVVGRMVALLAAAIAFSGKAGGPDIINRAKDFEGYLRGGR